jgi:hypothetical protein
MYQLQTVVVQQPTEEIPHREVEAALEEGGEDDLLLESSLGNCSPAAALHSTSTFGPSSPRSTSAWILASLIVDRTHAACGSGMEAPSAAISPLGLMLDLMWHKVFTRIRRRMMARSGGASTCLAGAGGWTDGGGSKAVARSLRRTRKRESDGGRRRGMGSTLP